MLFDIFRPGKCINKVNAFTLSNISSKYNRDSIKKVGSLFDVDFYVFVSK